MRALEFAAIGAFIGVTRHQCIMRTAHVAARAGYAVLLNGHIKPRVSRRPPVKAGDASLCVYANWAGHTRNVPRFQACIA